MKKTTVLIASALCAATLFADGWTWSGKSDAVTITAADSPVDITDADVAVVNALSSLTVEEGATLNLKNSANTLAFGATPVLSGAGSIVGAKNAKADFSGDARGFTGTMSFTQSWITVTSEWGLGESTVGFDSGPAYNASVGQLRFSGEGTNCHAYVTVAGWTNNEEQRLTAAGGIVVFSKDFAFSGTSSQYFNGLVCNGKFTAGNGSISFVAGGRFVFNGPVALRGVISGKNFWVSENAEVLFNSADNKWNDDFPRFCGQGTLRFGVAGALDRDRAFCTLTSGEGHTPVFDLCGHDQGCTYVSNYTDPANVPEGDFPTFTSETPATLTMSANGNYGAVIKFSGKVSHKHIGRGTYTMHRCYSDTEGSLIVTDGAVKLDNAGWAGDVELSGGGRLVMSAGSTLEIGGLSDLVIAEGSDVEIPAGHTVYCRSVVYGGENMTDGTYTDGSGFVSGGGTLVVAKRHVYTGAGEGWSDPDNWDGGVPSPGTLAVIPSGVTAEIGDGDKALVESLTMIVVQGTLTFANVSEKITVSADLSGPGTVSAVDAAGGLEFSGENGGLTGKMTFSGTPVTVSGRYALGSTSRTVSHSDALLRFTGDGLICDVPLWIKGSRTASAFGRLAAKDDHLVLNGDVTFYCGETLIQLELGDVDFNGKTRTSGTKGLNGFLDGVVTFAQPLFIASLSSYQWMLKTEDSELHMFKRDPAGLWSNMTVGGPGRYVCEGADALSASRDISLGNGTYRGAVVDLNGYEQQVRAVVANRYGAADPFECVITSAVPAQIMIADPRNTVAPVSFRGYAGLGFGAPFAAVTGAAFSGDNRYTISNSVSDTEGLLSVTNGTFVSLIAGAEWHGDLLVAGEGSVISIDSDSSLDPDWTSEVTIRDGGRLQLAKRVNIARLVVGEEEMKPGTYSASNFPDAISGAGYLRIGKFGTCISFR